MSYWNETMGDDVSLIVNDSDGYANARVVDEVLEEIKKGKKKGQMKLVSWDGRLIPKTLIIDEFFADMRNTVVAERDRETNAQARLNALIEDADEDSELARIVNDGKPKEADFKAALKNMPRLEELDDVSRRDREQLQETLDLIRETNTAKKKADELNKALDERCHEQYAQLTDEQVIDLLVNRKWLATIGNGIEVIYDEVANQLSDRITQLADRYAYPLPRIEQEAARLEARVKASLKEMGYEW